MNFSLISLSEVLKFSFLKYFIVSNPSYVISIFDKIIFASSVRSDYKKYFGLSMVQEGKLTFIRFKCYFLGKRELTRDHRWTAHRQLNIFWRNSTKAMAMAKKSKNPHSFILQILSCPTLTNVGWIKLFLIILNLWPENRNVDLLILIYPNIHQRLKILNYKS